jgi:hypothetical protein
MRETRITYYRELLFFLHDHKSIGAKVMCTCTMYNMLP